MPRPEAGPRSQGRTTGKGVKPHPSPRTRQMKVLTRHAPRPKFRSRWPGRVPLVEADGLLLLLLFVCVSVLCLSFVCFRVCFLVSLSGPSSTPAKQENLKEKKKSKSKKQKSQTSKKNITRLKQIGFENNLFTSRFSFGFLISFYFYCCFWSAMKVYLSMLTISLPTSFLFLPIYFLLSPQPSSPSPLLPTSPHSPPPSPPRASLQSSPTHSYDTNTCANTPHSTSAHPPTSSASSQPP